MVFRPYAIRINLNRKGHRTIELTRDAFTAVKAGILIIADGFSASDPDSVSFASIRRSVFADTRQFDYCDEVIVLLENVGWGKWTHTCRRIPEPIARPARVQCPLNPE